MITQKIVLAGLAVGALLSACTTGQSADELQYRFTVGQAATLSFDPPVVHQQSIDAPVPAKYETWFDGWEIWPVASKKNPKGAISLGFRHDEDGTLILGGLYGATVPGSVVVTSADGGRTFKENVDYKVQYTWGRVAALSDAMGEAGKAPLKVTFKYATQRLDLVQADSAGKLSVKPGEPRMVCPQLPEPDAGKKAIAGVYIAPWQRDGKWTITKDDVFMIDPKPPVAPIHPENIAKTRAKLAAGETVRIAFIGDSITLGAEAGPWWDEQRAYTAKDETYRGRVVYGLRQQYPKATVEPIEAYKGGESTPYAAKMLEQNVLPAKPDLILIAMGANDVASSVKGNPKVPVDQFKQAMVDLTRKARKVGVDVLLVVEMPQNPWMLSGVAKRWPSYRQAMLDAAKAEGACVADVSTEWENMASRGIPPYSQLHNWINHPGPAGHKLFADVILRCFTPGSGATATLTPTPAQAEAEPAMAKSDSKLLAQPTEIPGAWTLGDLNFPPAEKIIARPWPTEPLYGIYTWCGEYIRYHKQFREVGWPTIRLAGPMDDEAMKLIVADGTVVMKTIGLRVDGKGRNRTHYDSDEACIAAYVKCAEDFLRRYGPNGTFFKENPNLPHRPITCVEILNEPNFQYLIPPRQGVGYQVMEAERFALYAKLMPAAYKAIKAGWPTVKVVGFAAGGAGSGDVRYIKGVHEANDAVAKSYDILSTHPYMDNVPPESFSIHSWGKYSVINNLASTRQIMAAHNAGDRPVWYTEVGWRITKADGGYYDTPAKECVSPELQAAYNVRIYALAARLGVERVTNMFITDTDTYNGGFISREGDIRPSGRATQQMMKLMPNPKLTAVVAEADDGVYVYRFIPDARLGAEQMLLTMAWRVAGPKQVDIDWPKDSATVIDMLGKQEQVKAKNGKLTVEIGPCPIYLR